MFRESRLTYFAADPSMVNPDGSTDANFSAPKTLTDNEKNEQEKQELLQRIQDLRSKLAASSLESNIKKQVEFALDSNDKDQLDLVEKLLVGKSINQVEFETKLTEIIDRKRGIKSNKKLPDIAEQVAKRSKRTANLTELTPSDVANQEKFKETLGRASQLSNQERDCQAELSQVLEPFVKSGKLTDEFRTRIVNLDPESPEFNSYLRKYLGELANNKKLVQKIKENKARHLSIIQKCETDLAALEKSLEENVDAYQQKKTEYFAISRLSKKTGLTISEGTRLEYLTVGSSLTQKRSTTEIQKVEYKRPESRYFTEDETNTDDKKELEDESLLLQKKLFITVATEQDGEVVQKTLSEKEFLEWVTTHEVTEVVEDLNDLEDRISFSEFGQKLKVGQEIEYITNLASGGKPIYETVEIEQIDPSNGVIRLSKPIKVYDSKFISSSSGSKSRTKQTVTFGEFAKWFNSHSAEQKMTIYEAQTVLSRMPAVLKNRYPDLDKDIWDFNPLPIEIGVGETLIWGDKKSVNITSIENDQITLSNGSVYTPGQFVRFVKENEVERESRIPSHEEIQEKIDKALDTSDKADKAKAVSKSASSTVDPDSTSEGSERKGLLASLWKDMTFLSISDLMKMWQVFEDYMKRRNERNSKRRVGLVGKKLPGRLGMEYQNLEQVAENEEVEKIKGELKEQGPDIWREKLVTAKDSDVLKACTILLCEAGAFDFEDPKIWAVYNRVFREKASNNQEYEMYKIAPDGRKNKAGFTSFDALKYMMDIFYGKLSGLNWYNQNKSAYGSEIEKFKSEAGGIEGSNEDYSFQLHDMLTRHANGEYISAARFDAYIRYIITEGKASLEDKMFYIIAGFVTRNKSTGTYLLSKTQLGDISGLLNSLPQVEFFTRFKEITGNSSPVARVKMRRILKSFDPVLDNNAWLSDPKQTRYNTKKVSKFLFEKINTHEAIQRRMRRIARNMREKFDHDDAHGVIPCLDYATIGQILSFTRGADPFLTPDGHANGLAGFNQYVKSLGEIGLENNQSERDANGFMEPSGLLQKCFKSFVIYEAYLFGRITNSSKTTLSRDMINATPPVDSAMTLRENAGQVKEVLRKIMKAYGSSEDEITLFLDFESGKKRPEQNKQHEQELEKFPDYFDSLIKRGGGPKKMLEIVKNEVQSGNLKGFSGERRAIDADQEGAVEEEEGSLGNIQDPRQIMGLTQKAANKNLEDSGAAKAA